MAGHALALEDATRSLALTDRTGRAVRHRVTVGLHAAREVVTLHRARKALTDRGARDIDDLTRREHVDFEFSAGGQGLAFALLEAKFLGRVARCDIGFGVVPGKRLRHPRRAARANGHLNGAIAVGFLVLDLRHAIGECLDHRHRNGNAGVSENAGHAAFAANQTNGHCQSSYGETKRPRIGCDRSAVWTLETPVPRKASGVGIHVLRPLKLDGEVYGN